MTVNRFKKICSPVKKKKRKYKNAVNFIIVIP